MHFKLAPELLPVALFAFFLGVFSAPSGALAAPLHGPNAARAQPVLPRLGEGGALDWAAERRLGDRIAAQLLQEPEVMDDAVLLSYVERLWRPLLAAAQAQGHLEPEMAERFAWRLMLVRERSVNAFALPGGYLGVHVGLLATLGSADEVAAVLAHELSHVVQRHISRMVAQQDRQAPLVMAAMVLGALAASQSKNADVLSAATVGGQALALQAQLNFTRDMEREADRVGYAVLTGAGFAGAGFVGLFDKLQQAARLNDDGAFPYLRTHPLSTERLADMANRVRLGPVGPAATSASAGGPPPSAALQALVRVRAQVLAESDASRLGALLQAEAPGVADAAVQSLAAGYGRVLAASRLRQHEQALQGVQALLRHPAGVADVQPLLLALALEVGQAAGWPVGPDWAQWAQQALANEDRAAWWWGAGASVELGRVDAAAKRLQALVVQHPEDAGAWQLLARAWEALGQPLRAVRAQAEARLALLDLPGAVDRLQAGRELARRLATNTAVDHMDASILDARWRELSQRLREQRAEEVPRR